MPPVSVPEESLDSASNEPTPAPSKPSGTIGIIYPPPEVRNIVDKTASFVARNGPEFEVRIRANEQNNTKFNFLNPGDPYNAYYQHKVTDFREMIAEGKVPQIEAQITSVPLSLPKVKQVTEIAPKDPPPATEFIADPPSISALDLDVVKLTAQFVARNGRNFLTNLMNREQRNYQFDFLRPQHSLFNYFTKLVEQYTKVLIPPSDVKEKLRKDVENPQNILGRVKYRVEWEKFQERERQKAEDEKEKERVSFAQVDWHDFVVVETVYFRENETGNLPPPVTRDQLGARILAQERYEQHKEPNPSSENEDTEMNMDVEMEVEEETTPAADKTDDSMDMEDENPRPPSPPRILPPRPPLPPSVAGQNIQIRHDYDPKAPKNQPQQVEVPDKYLISPITGERVPAERMAEHMKINLLDPRWREQADKYKMDKQHQEEVLAHGMSIGSSLKQFALRRTDIFGAGDKETVIGKKIGEEDSRQPEKVTWDGHTASMATATRLAQEGITLDQQIEAIHKSKGLAHSEEAERIGPAIPKMSHQMPPRPDMMMPHRMPPMPPMPPRPPHMPSSAPPVRPPPPPGPPRGMLRHSHPMPPQPPPMRMLPVQPPPQPEYRAVPPPPPNHPPAPPPQRYIIPAPPVQPPPDMFDEPSMKRAKVELSEAHLMPEDLFLRHHSGPVRFTVQVPNMPDKGEWNLNGQGITFTLPLTDQISVIKAKIHEATGMPAGKQKLQLGSIFVKDSNSLAFYNFTRESIVQLQLKERGGRKK